MVDTFQQDEFFASGSEGIVLLVQKFPQPTIYNLMKRRDGERREGEIRKRKKGEGRSIPSILALSDHNCGRSGSHLSALTKRLPLYIFVIAYPSSPLVLGGAGERGRAGRRVGGDEVFAVGRGVEIDGLIGEGGFFSSFDDSRDGDKE